MTEEEWLELTDWKPLVAYLRVKKRERKVRLLSCACCWQFGCGLLNPEFADAIATAEHFADKLTPKAALKRARRKVCQVRHSLDQHELSKQWIGLWLAEVATSENAAFGVIEEILRLEAEGFLGLDKKPALKTILRDIFGNPFRPITLDHHWLTSNVVDLARTIYEEKAFERMPILADALMDAGCDHDDILNHCRSAGPHVRGCFVVDLILGKE